MKKTLLAASLSLLMMASQAAENSRKRILSEIEEGRSAMARGRSEEALRHFHSALGMVEASDNEKEGAKERVRGLLDKARQGQREQAQERLALQRSQTETLAKTDLERVRDLDSKRVASLLAQVKILVDRQDYKGAERLSRIVLEKDPANKTARHYAAFSASQADARRFEDQKRAKARGFRDAQFDQGGNFTLQTDTMTFPEDFAQKARERNVEEEAPEQEWKTQLRSRLTVASQADFESVPFDHALTMLQSVHDIVIFVDPRCHEEELEGGLRLVTLRGSKMSVETALRWMVEPLGLKVGLKDGAVYIGRAKDMREDFKMKMYDVRDLSLVPTDYVGPEISLAGGDEGGCIFIEPKVPDDKELDLEGLKALIENIIEDQESRYK